MARKSKILARQRRLSTITAAAPTGTPIVAAWDATFSITAEAPATNPNPSAKLDNPDAQGGKSEPGPVGGKQTGKDGKPPIPRFNMTAYNGGPMRLNGYRFPVIVDGTGIRAAASNVPIYCGHSQPWDDPADQMEQLMGQTDEFSVDQATGQITASGAITGESEMVKSALAHSKNGFKWQASINAQPSKIDFLPEGVQANVNGRPVTGPMVIARAVTCDHIALVPLGADTSTTAAIAASAAKGTVMEFAAWLKATYELDAATLTASQKTKFESEFARISATGAAPAAVVPPVTAPDITAQATAATNAAITAHRAALAGEQERISKVQSAAKDYPDICAQAIKDGWTVDKTELEVLRAARAASQQSPNVISSPGNLPKDGLQLQTISATRGGRQVASGGRITNDLAAVIETAGLISAGYSAERLSKNPAYGVRAVEVAEATMARFGRSLGPMGLMRLACSFAGVNLPHNNEDAYKAITAEFSTLSLPTILSNLMNKFLLDSYTAVDPDHCAPAEARTVAWQQFTKRGPVQDFKPHYRVRLTGDLEMKRLGPGGEIQSGKVSEQSYSLQADTKAILFSLTRKDIVNDDLSAMSTLPTLFGRGAGVRVAKLIYALLIAGLQSDMSTAFFSSSAITTVGNLMQPNLITSSALAFATLESAEAALIAQTDPTGQPSGIVGEILLVPPGLKSLALQLYGSEYLIPSLSSSTGGAASLRGVPQNNTMKGRFRPVCSSWLASLTAAQCTELIGKTTANAGSNTTWYLSGGPQQPAYPIEAGFLNGQEMPIVERDEMQFDRLGISFRGFIDFGASLAEPRSIVKATA